MNMNRFLSVLGRSTLAVAGLGVILLQPVQAAEIKVGGYEFPPFVDAKAPGGGLAPAMVDALNGLNSGHTFTFVSTSPKRRYSGFQKGSFDMMLFEMPIWGWDKESVDYETTPTLLKGGEVYVGHVDTVTGQSYFDWLGDKKLAGMLGYHYGFADFNSDRDFMESKFDIELTTTHRGNLGKVLKKRIDIAVVTRSFLALYFLENPSARDKLVLSEKLDQEYSLPGLVSADSPIDAVELTSLFEQLKASGKLQEVLDMFGIAEQWAL